MPSETTIRMPTAYHRVTAKVRVRLCALACAPARVSNSCTSSADGSDWSGCHGWADPIWQLAGVSVGSLAAERSCTQARKAVMMPSWSGSGTPMAVSCSCRLDVTASKIGRAHV